jgi:hypothetical protein
MKKIVSLIIVIIAIFLVSCKKDETTIVPENKSNFVLLDKTIMINGVDCYQYKNSSTGQIVYEEVTPNTTAKEATYTLKGEKKWNGSNWIIDCVSKGTNCRIGTICVEGQSVDVVVLKPGTKIN